MNGALDGASKGALGGTHTLHVAPKDGPRSAARALSTVHARSTCRPTPSSNAAVDGLRSRWYARPTMLSRARRRARRYARPTTRSALSTPRSTVCTSNDALHALDGTLSMVRASNDALAPSTARSTVRARWYARPTTLSRPRRASNDAVALSTVRASNGALDGARGLHALDAALEGARFISQR
ncbi:hypothetical protein AURDEDRAFT_168037 [Auricularia subglabra TFB-10046 SS5]|nr:hypothetical protein AURDEDRAFT_168037 [Auricularia subglabra TFB-10046 SS5]